MKKAFTDYVKNTFYDALYREAEYFIESNSDSFDFDELDLHTIGDIEIEDAEIKQIWIQEGKENEIKYDVAFSVNLIVKDGHRHYDDEKYLEKWLLLKCASTFDNDLKTIDISYVDEFVSKSRLERPLSETLIPFIKGDDYEKIADSILREHYPEVLKYGAIIEPKVLADRLGLNILEKCI